MPLKSALNDFTKYICRYCGYSIHASDTNFISANVCPKCHRDGLLPFVTGIVKPTDPTYQKCTSQQKLDSIFEKLKVIER